MNDQTLKKLIEEQKLKAEKLKLEKVVCDLFYRHLPKCVPTNPDQVDREAQLLSENGTYSEPIREYNISGIV